MALKTKKEFAEMCGIATKHISTYAGRRQIVVNDDGMIDDEDEVNYAFLIQKGFVEAKKKNGTADGRSTKKTTKPKTVKKPAAKKKPGPKPKAKPKAKEEESPKPPEKTPEQLEIEYQKQKRIEELATMDREKLQADTDKKRHDAEISRIKMEKLQGLLIPTELVTNVIQLQADSLKKAYHEAAEKLLIIISQQAKMNNKQLADMRKKLVDDINVAIDEGIENSKKGLNEIVKNYSETRGVGEAI